MVVAAGAGKIHREKGSRRRRDLLVDDVEAQLVRVGALVEPLPDREKSGSGEPVEVVFSGQEISRELLRDETIVGLVLVEALHDVVAVGFGEVDLVNSGHFHRSLNVAGDIEPMAAPAFAVVRRGEEAVDEIGEGGFPILD